MLDANPLTVCLAAEGGDAVLPDSFRFMLDSLDAAICVVDRELRVAFVNRAWNSLARNLGRSDMQAERLAGSSIVDVLHDSDHKRWYATYARLIDGEEASFWTELSWPIGNRRGWLALNARTLFDAAGEAIGITFTLTDVSDRKRNEEEMTRRREELRGLFELAQTVGLVNDEVELRRRVTGHLSYLFKARLCVIALRDEETGQVIAHGPARGVDEGALPQFELPAPLLTAMSASAPSYVLCSSLVASIEECRTFGRRWQVNGLLIAPLRNQGRLLGYLVLADDANKFADEEGHLLATFGGLVSAAIDANSLLRVTQARANQLSEALIEIQELDRLKDDLIQNVSHELRLPLMVIQGYIDLLKTGAFGALAPELQKTIEIVSEKTELLGRRVNDIMLLRGVQRTDLQLSLVSLAALAREAVERARPQAEKNKVRLVADIVPETAPLMADYRRMEEVIDQLLDNAIKFSPDGGEVRVLVHEGGDVVYLKVADQGIGIPASQINRIWDRFYQSDGSTTRRFGGTGVGLAVVKQIIEAHGGQVWAESQVGQGSQFYMALHRSAATEASLPAQEAKG